jgi:hypothetical protein
MDTFFARGGAPNDFVKGWRVLVIGRKTYTGTYVGVVSSLVDCCIVQLDDDVVSNAVNCFSARMVVVHFDNLERL